jgi:redox-sensitive bicupin YhaK (pirin superfamily)
MERPRLIGNRNLIAFDDGDLVTVSAEADAVRFLPVSGKPIGEPVAWQGPIVMNIQEALRIGFEELDRGTFINKK